MIRVLYTAANPIWSAIEQAQASLFSALDRSQFEVHLACTRKVRPDGGASVLERASALKDVRLFPMDFGPSLQGATRAKVFDLLTSGPRVPASFLGLVRYILSHRIDVVHCSQKPYDAMFGVLSAKVTGRKCVLHMHVKCEPWLGPRVRWAMKNADLVLGVSRFTADSVLAGTSAAKDRVTFVHNPLDLGAWNQEVHPLRIRREFGVPDGAPLLGIVGRLNQWKGQADLLDAFPILLEKHPTARLLIVGDEDPWSHGSQGYRAELAATILRRKLGSSVHFSGFRRDIRDVMASFDVFACPTWEEPFGMVFLEAMAMQKPVVAITSGAAGEIVVNGETGLLVPPKNPAELAGAISRLIEQPELRARMGAAGRARVESDFSPARLGGELAGIYTNLVKPR
jgi:glycosyltransferase involved in cell wall biosynthesis